MKKSIDLEYLKKGDLVSIVSIAKYITKKDCDFALTYIQSKGLNIFPLENTILSREGMFSGTNIKRKELLQSLLDNAKIKAIFFARGGYGSIRILDELNFEKFIKNPKWLIGFSDITVLLSHVSKNYNLPVIHAPMPYNFPMSSKKSLNMLFKLLFGKTYSIKIKSSKHNKQGVVKGKIIGGNLSILCSLLGSKSFPIAKGNILLIEDVGEYLYSIDRMVHSLIRSNVLNNLSGLIVGRFSNTKDNKPRFGQNLYEIILKAFENKNLPICFDFPVGHIRNNMPVFLNKTIMLKIDQYTELRYL